MAILVGLLAAAWAADWVAAGDVRQPIQVLAPSDATQGYGEDFGAVVAISGDWIVVGAPSDDELAGDGGAAYVFRRQGPRWVEHQKFHGDSYGDGFGSSVSIDGDWIVVSAPHPDTFGGGIGWAAVFQRDDRSTPHDLSDDIWAPAAFLHPPPSHLCCQFGATVRIDGDVIAVGSLRGEFHPGRAYIFHWDGAEWLGPQTIMPSDSAPGDFFGRGVAVTGDLVAVTASGDTYDCPGFEQCSGSGYVFRRHGDTWTEEAKLMPTSGFREIGGIGSRVGASERGIACGGWGVVQVFQRASKTEWMKETVLTPSDSPVSQFASYSLAMKGHRVLVSAAHEFWGYLFQYQDGAWTEVLKLQRPQQPPGLDFSRVALDGVFALALQHVYAIAEEFTLADYAALQNCVGQAPGGSGCERFDLEPEQVIDARDLPLFLLTFEGPE